MAFSLQRSPATSVIVASAPRRQPTGRPRTAPSPSSSTSYRSNTSGIAALANKTLPRDDDSLGAASLDHCQGATSPALRALAVSSSQSIAARRGQIHARVRGLACCVLHSAAHLTSSAHAQRRVFPSAPWYHLFSSSSPSISLTSSAAHPLPLSFLARDSHASIASSLSFLGFGGISYHLHHQRDSILSFRCPARGQFSLSPRLQTLSGRSRAPTSRLSAGPTILPHADRRPSAGSLAARHSHSLCCRPLYASLGSACPLP